MISLEELLHMKKPYELFAPEGHSIKDQRNQLLKQFHPDANGGGEEFKRAVFLINSLYEEAVKSLDAGIWESPGRIVFSGKDGKNHEMRFQRSYPMDLGMRYIGSSSILYLFDKENEVFCDNYLESQKNLRYVDRRMKEEFSKYLPRIIARFQTKGGRIGLVVHKDTELINLSEILQYFNGRMEPRSVAWILSSLYNLLCFLEFNGINHNDITLDNYFISPENHYGAMLGGWWYSKREGESLDAITESIYNLMTKEQMDSLQSMKRLDLESLHNIGRILLGDVTGNSLAGNNKIPKSFADWVRGPVYGSVLEEYERYNEVLERSFGSRRFYPMEINKKEFDMIIGGK